MKNALIALAVIIYLGTGLIQFFAIISGLQHWIGTPIIISGIVAIFIAWLPVIGTIVGIIGAVKSRGWQWYSAVILFCWPFVVYLLVILIYGTAGIFKRHVEF